MTVTTVPTATYDTPSRMRMFTANVRAEWTTLRSVRSTMWTLLATVGLAVGFGALIGASQMGSWHDLDPAERLLLAYGATILAIGGAVLVRRDA